jgi:hypothetical protein
MEPSTTHRTHDESLVVRLYGGDVSEVERERALSLVADCDSCATLFADLGAIAMATAALPVPARPRDFTICAEDAELLRPAPQRGRAGILGLGRLRSLGGSLVALGLAGFVLIGGASVLPQMAGNTADTKYSNLAAADGSQGGVGFVTAGPVAASTEVNPNVPAGIQGGQSAGSPEATAVYGFNSSAPADAAGATAAPPQPAGQTPGQNTGQVAGQTPGTSALQGRVTGPVTAVPTSSSPAQAPDLRVPAAVGSALLLLLGLFFLLRPRRA